jgi:hypothetical protein
MPFTAGTFALFSPGNPVVTGTTISSTWANNTLNDIASGLSTCILKDGTQVVTANIPMAGFKLTGLSSGSASGDSFPFGQAEAVLLSQSSVAGSATAAVDFTGLSSAYDQYMLRISRCRPADVAATTVLYVRVSTDGGATFAGNGDYSSNVLRVGGTGGATVTALATLSASGMLLISPGGLNVNAEFILDNPSSTSLNKTARFEAAGISPPGGTSNLPIEIIGSASYIGSVSAINAIRVFYATSNIGQGLFSLYGIKFT